MRIVNVFVMALIACAVFEASASEYARYTGVLMRGGDGAVLVSDDGTVYRVPGMSNDFLNRHAGRRVTMVGELSVMTGSGNENAVIHADEIIVTAPRVTTTRNEAKSKGTKAAEGAQLVIPPLIPPF